MSELFTTAKDVEFTASFEMSAAAVEWLQMDAENTRRTITVTHSLHYSRWYRFVIAVLRFAYGWLGYRGPVREITTVVPGMKITSVIEDEHGLHIEASTKT